MKYDFSIDILTYLNRLQETIKRLDKNEINLLICCLKLEIPINKFLLWEMAEVLQQHHIFVVILIKGAVMVLPKDLSLSA